MKGREVFRCDIRNLYFNIDCADDPVCQRLISVVEEAKERMYDLNNLPKFRSINDGRRAFQNQNAETTQELLHSDVDLIYEIPRIQTSPTKLPLVDDDKDADQNDSDQNDSNKNDSGQNDADQNDEAEDDVDRRMSS